jgi:hypothetical protein
MPAPKRKQKAPKQLKSTKKLKETIKSINAEEEIEDESLPQLQTFQTNSLSTSLNLQLQQQQQLNIQLQQKIQSIESTQPKKPVPKKKRVSQVPAEMVEVVSIEYVVSSSKHRNNHLNGYIDRYAIEEIEGFGVEFQIEDVKI